MLFSYDSSKHDTCLGHMTSALKDISMTNQSLIEEIKFLQISVNWVDYQRLDLWRIFN